MNEAETRAELIDPALKAAGWGAVAGSRVRREVITIGRIQGAGTRAKQDIADYVLVYKNQKLAVIEAKRESASVTEGLEQAKKYAQKLQTSFAYATNGHGIYRVDMRIGEEGHADRYPTPDELCAAFRRTARPVQKRRRTAQDLEQVRYAPETAHFGKPQKICYVMVPFALLYRPRSCRRMVGKWPANQMFPNRLPHTKCPTA